MVLDAVSLFVARLADKTVELQREVREAADH
eukprot:COSAG04_NODE_876_length_9689_cov_6.190407_6_plen_31_part_00